MLGRIVGKFQHKFVMHASFIIFSADGLVAYLACPWAFSKIEQTLQKAYCHHCIDAQDPSALADASP
jgi:hypothetical protein